MLLQKDRPLWQANYKSMSSKQLCDELDRVSKNPHRDNDRAARKAFLVTELALKWKDYVKRPIPSIILAEPRETKMPLTIVDGPTIAQGESLSDGADCSGGSIVRITIPQEFTDANLTFQASSDGNLYNDLYDNKGDEVTLAVKPDTTVVVSAHWTRSIGFVKFRSGTRAAPVEQKTDCKFAIAVDSNDAAP
jgi:hypothetical protein